MCPVIQPILVRIVYRPILPYQKKQIGEPKTKMGNRKQEVPQSSKLAKGLVEQWKVIKNQCRVIQPLFESSEIFYKTWKTFIIQNNAFG